MWWLKMCQRFDKYEELAINLNVTELFQFVLCCLWFQFRQWERIHFFYIFSSLIMLRLFTHTYAVSIMFDCFNSMFVKRFLLINVLIVMMCGKMSEFQFELIKSSTEMCDIDNELNRNHTYFIITSTIWAQFSEIKTVLELWFSQLVDCDFYWFDWDWDSPSPHHLGIEYKSIWISFFNVFIIVSFERFWWAEHISSDQWKVEEICISFADNYCNYECANS